MLLKGGCHCGRVRVEVEVGDAEDAEREETMAVGVNSTGEEDMKHGGANLSKTTKKKKIVCYDCNCTVCYMRRNTHFVVPLSRFRIIQGEECLTTYRYNTQVAKHTFCSTCGISCFYYPRSNPDGVAITLWCLDRRIVEDDEFDVEIRNFDGLHWEDNIEKSGISEMSKE
eukprot:762669-Hanusia_phi.AAC.1